MIPFAEASTRTMLSLSAINHAKHERAQSGFRIALKPFSMTILGVLHMAFPQKTVSMDKKLYYTRASAMLPLMYTLNDFCDVGIPAILENQVEEEIREKSVQLYAALWDGYVQEREYVGYLFKDKHSKSVIDVLEHDSIALADLRNNIKTEDIPTYLEIDNALFEIASYELLLPGSLQSLGFNPYQPCDSWEAFCKKYEVLIGKNNSPQDSPSLRAVRGAHAAEMLLKIGDDLFGAQIDERLGVPNFFNYAKASATDGNVKKRLNEITDGYQKIASNNGYPDFLLHVIKKIIEYGGKLVLFRSKKPHHLDFDKTLEQLEREVFFTFRDYFFSSDAFKELFAQDTVV